MADQNDLMQAKQVFDTLCQTLDGHDWEYEKDESELTIECGAQGEDLPIQITIRIDPKRHVAMLLSHMPFVTSEEKRLEMAVAISVVNNRLVDGSFDFDISDGHMFFRMTTSFLESTIGSKVFTYMLYCSCKTVDEYNDKYLMLAKNMLTIEQFIGMVNH